MVLVVKCGNKANPDNKLPLTAQKTHRKVPWSLLNRKMKKECHVRWKFHPGRKCYSPHYRGPCLSVKPYLSSVFGQDIKLAAPCMGVDASVTSSIHIHTWPVRVSS